MPLYIYECDACEIVLEELCAAARAPEFVECPVCHGLCTRAVAATAAPRRAQSEPAAPAYGRVPAGFHGGCACCAPRRR